MSYRAGFPGPLTNDQFGILPIVGLRTRQFDLSAEYKLGGAAHWVQLRGSVRLRY